MRFVLTGFKLFEIYRPSYKFTDTSRLLPCASVLPYHIAPCNEKPAPLSAATREPNPPKFHALGAKSRLKPKRAQSKPLNFAAAKRIKI